MARLSKKELDALGIIDQKPKVSWSLRIAKKIAALHAEGHSMAAISRMPGMPHKNTLSEWLKKPEFKIRMDAAKESYERVQADAAEQRILDIAQGQIGKDEAPGARVRLEANRIIAEANNPAKFGKKVTHGGDKDNPIRFVVSTGFPEPNEHQRPPKLNSDGTIQKISGPDGPFHEEEGP